MEDKKGRIEAEAEAFTFTYLDSDVVRTVPAEGIPQHLVNGLGNTVEYNVNHRRR